MGELSRRALFPAAIGSVIAAPDVAKAAMQDLQATQQLSAYRPAPSMPAEDPHWRSRQRESLLKQKSDFERWARGEFEDAELDDVNEPDPRYRRFATTEQEIAGLRSVSAVHKVRMAETVSRKRYAEYRKKNATDYLKKIIEELRLL